MGTIIGSKLLDEKALQLNGVDQFVRRDDPDYKNASAGSWAFDLTVLSLLPGSGSQALIRVGDRDAPTTTYNKQIYINVRQHANLIGGVTKGYIDMTDVGDGVTIKTRSGQTSLVVGTRYRIYVGSAGKIYINGVEESYQNWRNGGIPQATGWHNAISAANKSMSMGAQYTTGSGSNFGNIRINNVHQINRVLTPTEITEDYNGGIAFSWRKRSYTSAIKHAYEFEGDLSDSAGSEPLTGTNVGPANYVTP